MSTLSRIGLKVPQQGLFGGEARKFYYEVGMGSQHRAGLALGPAPQPSRTIACAAASALALVCATTAPMSHRVILHLHICAVSSCSFCALQLLRAAVRPHARTPMAPPVLPLAPGVPLRAVHPEGDEAG
jgi:hypothetical protein